MPKRQQPAHSFDQAKEWLVQVFGPEILFESSASKMRAGENKDAASCAWRMDSSGDLLLDIDLPPLIMDHFVERLRHHLNMAMIEAIVPDPYKKGRQKNLETLRRSDWPLPTNVIENNLLIRGAALRKVAEKLPKRAEGAGGIVRDLLEHEAVWIARKRNVEKTCNRLFLGREDSPDGALRIGFRYGSALGEWPKLELVLPLSSYVSPFPDHGLGIGGQWEQRNDELGLDGFMIYATYNPSGMGATMKTRLAIRGINDADIANRLEKVRESPKTCAAVRQYVHEVIAATTVPIWFPYNTHPYLYQELEAAFDQTPQDMPADGQAAWREKQAKRLQDKPKYTDWRETFPQIAKTYSTMGRLVLAVHADPPPGQEDIFGTLRQWFQENVPLLKGFVEAPLTATKPVFSPTQPQQGEKQVPGGPG